MTDVGAPRAASTASAFADGLERVLADRSLVRPVFQPIVDLRSGEVAGYEALARFGVEPVAPPDHWFAAARTHGVASELEAAVLGVALEARHRLPGNRFLTVNAGPDALGSLPVARLLDGIDDLGGVFVELTEQGPLADQELLRHALDGWRRRGARIGVDDRGAGYAGLCWLLDIRPDLLKLDRSVVADVDRDEAKLAIVEMVGALAGRLGAWVIAEGIERVEELDALSSLGVPYGQGWALGRPAEDWQPCEQEAADRIRGVSDRLAGSGVLALTELRPVIRHGPGAAAEARRRFQEEPALDLVVAVDVLGRAKALHARSHPPVAEHDLVHVGLGTQPSAAALRALRRPRAVRFTALVCSDDSGRLLGVVPFERLVSFLAVPGPEAPPV